MKILRFIAYFALLAVGSSSLYAAPVGTAFSYQGRLSAGADPVNGLYDFSLGLFDAATGGTQIGSTIALPAVPVTNGLFTLAIDFGNVLDGNARWLAIGVKTNGAGSYTPLAPLQPLTPAPYAVYSPAAGSASLASSVAPGAVTGAGLASGAVGTANIAPGAVTTATLADNSVTSAKLAWDAASLAKVTAGGMAKAGSNIVVTGASSGIDTNLFTGLGLQYDNPTGEAAILSSYNSMDFGHGFLSFYTKANGGLLTRHMIIGYNGNVSIGTATINPYAVLEVNGTNAITSTTDGLVNIGPDSGYHLTLDGDDIQAKNGVNAAALYLNYWGGDSFIGNGGTALQVHGAGVGVGGGPGDSTLNVLGQLRLNDSDIVLRRGTDLNHGLGYRASVNGIYVDGPFLFGYNGGALGVSGPDIISLSWNYLGNVSVSNNLTAGAQFVVDNQGANTGSLAPGITFGPGSGEGISSKRNPGGNQFGLDFYTAFAPRMSIDNGGGVFINSSSANGYRLYVNGPAYSTGGWSGSDVRWKKNVRPITRALEKVAKLQGVSYDWRREDFPDRAFEDGPQLGFIAQEVEKVLPEAVRTDSNGYKAIAYEKLTAVLAEGIKEQQSQIDSLKAQNAALERRLTELGALVQQALAK